MKILIGTVATLSIALALAGCGTAPAGTVSAKGLTTKNQAAKRLAPAAKPVQVLVKFKAQMNVAALESFRVEFGTRNVGVIAGLGVYVEELAPGVKLDDAFKAIQASPLVEYVELNAEVGIR